MQKSVWTWKVKCQGHNCWFRKNRCISQISSVSFLNITFFFKHWYLRKLNLSDANKLIWGWISKKRWQLRTRFWVQTSCFLLLYAQRTVSGLLNHIYVRMASTFSANSQQGGDFDRVTLSGGASEVSWSGTVDMRGSVLRTRSAECFTPTNARTSSVRIKRGLASLGTFFSTPVALCYYI